MSTHIDTDDDDERDFTAVANRLARAIMLLELAASHHRLDGYWSDTVDGLVQDAIVSLGGTY